MRVFGVIFAFFWVMIWVVAISAIIKSIKTHSKITNATKDVFRVADQTLRRVNVHTGDPRNPYTEVHRSEPTSADAFSDIAKKQRDSDTFSSDLNPKADTQRVYRKPTTVNGRKARGGRIYSVNNEDRPAHGKLSRESRDDEKEWF